MDPQHGAQEGSAQRSSGPTSLHGRGSEARQLRSGVLRLVAGFVVFLACMLALGSIAEDVYNREANFLDSVANPYLHGLASPALDAVMGAATFMGSVPALPALFIAATAVLLYLHRRREATFLVIALGGSFVINQVLKLAFHRPRPQLAWAHVQPEYSFPSGHSENGLAFYLALALVVWVIAGRRPGILAVALASVLALLIGVSRVYFGYHYVTDVVGGYLAAIAWLLVVGAAFDAGPLLREWRRERETNGSTRPRGATTPASP